VTLTQFEIYAEQPAKLADFYRALFGWQIDRAPGLDYWRIRTGMADNPGGRPALGPNSWLHYINVTSLDDVLAKVERLGGTIVRRKTAVPKTAWYSIVADPEGNLFGIWEADAKAFPRPSPE
jgi:predicted enzyme related to lactoylglutathione lyase